METMASKKPIRSETLRMKLLDVLGDGDPRKLSYALFHLNNLVEAEGVCDWLIARKLTGKRLEEWMNVSFKGMFLPLFDHVRAKVCLQNIGGAVRKGDFL